ncbi:MAG: TIR domain-containing protein [Candidatus Brocadiales bacterium]
MAKYPKEERIPPSLKPSKAIELLQKQIEKIDELLQKRHDNPEVDNWENSTEQYIIRAFGEPHGNLSAFRYANHNEQIWDGMSDGKAQDIFIERLCKRRELLKGFIEQLGIEEPGEVSTEDAGVELRGNKIFFAYAIKRKNLVLELARHVEQEYGLKTKLMAEEPHGGRSLTEKFEDMVNECGFGVFVLTADDVYTTSTGKREKYARQNVILELGYFWGRLGRRKQIAVLVEEGVEIPTDIKALGWIQITGDLGQTKLELTKELKDAGFVRKA